MERTRKKARLLNWLPGFLLLFVVLFGCDRAGKKEKDESKTAVQKITVSFTFANSEWEESRSFEIEVAPSTTVFGGLEHLESQGSIVSSRSGTGETGFVSSIGGVKNRGANGNNWIYRVNGNLGKFSSDLYELQAGDQVVWSFGKYEPEKE